MNQKHPPVKARFAAMKELSDNEIMTGTIFMPILPFIYDTERNIEGVIKKTTQSGGQYILSAELTLWGYCGTFFYKALEKYDEKLVPKYKELYKSSQRSNNHFVKTNQSVLKYCKKHNLSPHIPRPINFYPKDLQINKKIAAEFYLKARDLQTTGYGGYKEWAYKKAAWTLDELEESIEKTYREKGFAGILNIKGIGKSLAKQIEELLSKTTT